MFKPGDKVSVINEKATGFIVKKINSTMYDVEIDGFIFQKNASELAKVFLSPEDITEVLHKDVDFKKPIFEEITPENISIYYDKRLKGKIMEIDLHFSAITEQEHRHKPWDRLNFQLDFLKANIDYAMQQKMKKIIVIHGVGAGILKNEALKLIQSFDRLRTEDASYHKYGKGATEVLIF